MTVWTPPPFQDLLVGILSPLGFRGFAQRHDSMDCYIEDRLWDPGLAAALRRRVANFSAHLPTGPVRIRTFVFRERNWNAAWERQIRPVRAARGITISPLRKNARRRGARGIFLTIKPQMSFGTGHHETTRLCLQLLEKHLRPETRVLDIGTGTGILAIAAAKLGAREVIAVDIDEWSIRNAAENIARNRVRNRVKLRRQRADTLTTGTFGLIACNLDYATISVALRRISRRLVRAGILILSGLLREDIPLLLPSFRLSGLAPVEVRHENEWVALALVKV